MSNCIFCKIAEGTIPAKIVHSDPECVAFRDINPGAPVHILVIPRRHIETINDLKDDQAGLLGRMTLLAKEIAASEGIAQSGYRLVLNCNRDAGQSVDHIHMHLLGGRAMQWPPG